MKPALLATILLTLAAAHAAPPTIKAPAGKLQGVPTPDNAVIAYKGIPFAAPPTGDLRWREPQPAKPWPGVFQAVAFGSHCIQFGGYSDMVFHDPGASEDCLTLNIWTPAAKHRKLPVMVWIYGGGARTGGTSELRQDGQYLALHNVIIVSMNYRLGPLGYLALPALTAESPHHASGNYGLMDQAAAVAWVARNIAAFGGDPANITLFGESAGSMSVSAQMVSPLAKNLLARATGESGGAFAPTGRYPSLHQAEQEDAAWATRAFGSADLPTLRALTPEAIVKAAASTATPGPTHTIITDGYVLPDTIPALYAAGLQAHIPLLAGWNADESHPRTPPSAAEWTAQAEQLFPGHAAEFLALYPAGTDEEAAASANAYTGDRFIAYSTWAWIEADAHTSSAPLYRYHFELPSPGDKNHPTSAGAFHSDDIEYVFGTLDSRPGMNIRPEDRQLSELIQSYWTNFARTGNPNAPNLPPWPAYTSPSGPVMHLNAAPTASPATDTPRYLFLQQQWSTPPTQP